MKFKSVVILTAVFSMLVFTARSYAEEKTVQPAPAGAEKAATMPAAPVTPVPAAPVTPPAPAVAESSPVAVLPEDTYDFKAVMEGVTIVHDFSVQNKGTADLEILAVKPG